MFAQTIMHINIINKYIYFEPAHNTGINQLNTYVATHNPAFIIVNFSFCKRNICIFRLVFLCSLKCKAIRVIFFNVISYCTHHISKIHTERTPGVLDNKCITYCSSRAETKNATLFAWIFHTTLPYFSFICFSNIWNISHSLFSIHCFVTDCVCTFCVWYIAMKVGDRLRCPRIGELSLAI